MTRLRAWEIWGYASSLPIPGRNFLPIVLLPTKEAREKAFLHRFSGCISPVHSRLMSSQIPRHWPSIAHGVAEMLPLYFLKEPSSFCWENRCRHRRVFDWASGTHEVASRLEVPWYGSHPCRYCPDQGVPPGRS